MSQKKEDKYNHIEAADKLLFYGPVGRKELEGIFMTISKVVHERGLIATSPRESEQIHNLYGLRPVLATKSRATGEHDFLLTTNGESLELQASALSSSSAGNMAVFPKVLALAYDAGAVVHHCRNLAKTYSDIVAQHERIRSIKGYEESASGFASFGFQAEPYYELDALLSASRRVYDKTGNVVWQAFEGGSGMPRNMTELLDRLKFCPQPLAARLKNSWTNVGKKLKDYRDCTQHFASTDIGMGTVTMKHLGDDIWVAWARIPDNPEVKSKKKFNYKCGFDALTYGWEVANEVISLATEVVAIAAAPRDVPITAGSGINTPGF